MKEIMSPFDKKTDFGVDTELDPIGVILDKPVYCGKCKTIMHAVKPGLVSCPNCHISFNVGE